MRTIPTDSLRSFDSVQGWHPNIEENNVGTQFCRLLNRLNAVTRLADDLPLWLLLQYGSDSDSPL
jgi:hypothetical protein